jgi:hypothetical protein
MDRAEVGEVEPAFRGVFSDPLRDESPLRHIESIRIYEPELVSENRTSGIAVGVARRHSAASGQAWARI